MTPTKQAVMPDRVRDVWRRGVVPNLSTPQLVALERELAAGGPHLIQGATTSPPPLASVLDWPAERSCLLAFAGQLGTVRETEERFCEALARVWQTLSGAPSSVCPLLHYWDDTPREEAIAAVLAEVRLALVERWDGRLPPSTGAEDHWWVEWEDLGTVD